ncbi:MAG: zinc ribbon domain-containing protein [Azoarcus sp.]|jgi:putative FmdB family regulatory protein|nr:zinc ribbon domain-containing protein [Azoarcus sp.]
MPIYEYRCEHCGFQKEHLQKMSDAPLTVCPSCAAPRYVKQISAAGFQLKGSGWYATDFKNEGAKQKAAAPAPASAPCGAGCACHLRPESGGESHA